MKKDNYVSPLIIVIGININGDFLATIAPPWAKGDNGEDIDTYYKINGNEVIQVIKHKNVDCTYPVVADPTIGNWFSNYKWSGTKVNGGYTLSLYATTYLRSMIQSTQNQTARTASWNAVVSKCSGHSNMDNIKNENPLLEIPNYMENMQWIMFLSAIILTILSIVV